jgi:hypothetical protein
MSLTISCSRGVSGSVRAGSPRRARSRRLQARLARHRDVQDRQVDRVREHAHDGFGAVAGLGDNVEIGLLVEHQHQTAQNDRVVVGD